MEAPIKSPSTESYVETYHLPSRLPRSVSTFDCLQVTVCSVNNALGRARLCLPLLVFGSIPRSVRCTPLPTQLVLAQVIEQRMKEVQKEQARRRVTLCLSTNGTTIRSEIDEKLRKFHEGSLFFVIVHTEENGRAHYHFSN